MTELSRKELKKLLLKFPFPYTLLNKMYKRVKRMRGLIGKAEGVDGLQLEFLIEQIGKGNLVLEIGAFKGQTSREIAKNNQVVAIDPFLADQSDGTLQGEFPSEVYSQFIKNTKNMNVVLIPQKSDEAFRYWDKEVKKKFDFIFIDGLHTYEGVKTDFK